MLCSQGVQCVWTRLTILSRCCSFSCRSSESWSLMDMKEVGRQQTQCWHICTHSLTHIFTADKQFQLFATGLRVYAPHKCFPFVLFEVRLVVMFHKPMNLTNVHYCSRQTTFSCPRMSAVSRSVSHHGCFKIHFFMSLYCKWWETEITVLFLYQDTFQSVWG